MKFTKDFSNIKSNYFLRINGYDSYDIKVTELKLYNSFQIFIKEFNEYSSKILKNKIFTEKELSEYIFEISFKNPSKYKESIRRNLYACKLYLENLDKKITSKNIKKYFDLLTIFLIDFEFLTYEIENFYLETNNKQNVNSGRNYFKDPKVAYEVSKTLFFIDDVKKIDELDFYDVRPYSIFALRQSIEMYGKHMLGVISIFDENDNFSKRHLNAAWDFIKLETNKKEKSRIYLPFNIDIILKIQKWTNRFVHTTTDAPYYTIFNATKMLEALFKSNEDGILCYDNKVHKKFNISDIRITDYNKLKEDFEKFINKNNEDNPNKFCVAWELIKKVDAYIISE